MRRALGYGLIGLGLPFAGPALYLFWMWLPGRRKGYVGWPFELPPAVIAWLWASLAAGGGLALLGGWLIARARRP